MRPIDIEADNIDFCMASAQKGLMAMTGLSFVIGSRKIIEASKDYPKRSYYCNLYLQYDFFEKTGEMHFTPPVQTVYAAVQALKEYWAEGEEANSFSAKCDNTSTPYLKFLCKFSRIFFRVYKFRNGGVAGYVEYSGLVQSGK